MFYRGSNRCFLCKNTLFLTLTGSESLLFCTTVSLLCVAPLVIFVAALDIIK